MAEIDLENGVSARRLASDEISIDEDIIIDDPMRDRFDTGISELVDPSEAPIITDEQIDDLIVPALAAPMYTPLVEMMDVLNRNLWDVNRIENAQKRLDNTLVPDKINPPDPTQLQKNLNEWWVTEGFQYPRFVLDEIGITGGMAPISFSQGIIEAQKENALTQVQTVKEALGVDAIGDPLRGVVGREFESDLAIATKFISPDSEIEDKKVEEKLESFDDESIEAIKQIVDSNVSMFDEEVVSAVNFEVNVRDKEEKFLEFMQESSKNIAIILWGTDFFNRLGADIPEFIDRSQGKGDLSENLEAISRIRAQVRVADPSLAIAFTAGFGNTAAELVLFALLPDPGKITAFASLSPAAKSAIGVGSRAAFTTLLKAPEEDETLEQRAAEMTKAGIAGAVTGAALSKIFGTANKIFDKLKNKKFSEQADIMLANNPQITKTKEELIEILKFLKSNDAAKFKDAISLKELRIPVKARVVKGARIGAAEIEKPAKIVKAGVEKAVKGIAKTKEAIAVQAAKEALKIAKGVPAKAVPVEKAKPTKILTMKEAKTFEQSNLVTGETGDVRIVADPPTIANIKTAEKKIATLKTQRNQLAADKKQALSKARGIAKAQVGKAKAVEIEKKAKAVGAEKERKIKAIEVEIAKKQVSIATLKEKFGIKLETTIEGFRAKIDKINAATEFKEELRDDAISMVQAIPKELQPNFLKRATDIGKQKQKPETSLKKVFKLNDEIRAGVEKFGQRQEIKNAKDFVKRLFKKHRLGNQPLGKLPEPQRSQILDIVNNTDFKKLTEAKEISLKASQAHFKKMAGQIASGFESLDAEELKDLQLPRKLSQELRRLEQKTVADMTTSDIRAIYDSLMALAKQAELKGKLLTKEGLKPLSDIDVEKEVSPKPSAIKKAQEPIEREKKTGLVAGAKRTGGLVRRFVSVDNYKLDTLADISTTNESKGIVKILDTDLHSGQRDMAANQLAMSQIMEEGFSKAGLKNVNQLSKKKTTGKLANQKVKLTDDMLLSLELATRDENYLDAIGRLEGWDIDGKIIRYPVDWGFAEKIAEMNKLLNDTRSDDMLVALADFTNQLSNGPFKSLINEASNALVGHDIARIKNQWPRPRTGKLSVSGAKDISVAPEQRSILQPRIGSSKPIQLNPWSETVLGSMETITHFNGMAIPLRNARALVSSQGFQDAMISADREEELRNMITLIRRIQGSQTSREVVEVLGSKVRNLFTVQVLGFRVSTTGTQAMSNPMFFAVTRTVSVVPRLTISEAIKRLKEDSPPINLRWRGRRIGAEIGAIASQETFDLLIFGKSTIFSGNVAMAQHVKGDQVAIAIGYIHNIIPEILNKPRNGKNISLEEWDGNNVADLPEMKDIDSREFREAAALRTEYATRKGQPMFDVLDRSVNLSSPSPLVRMVTMFRSALEAQQNLLVSELSRYNKIKNPTLNDRKRLWAALSAVVVSAALVAIWKKSFKWGVRFGSKKVKEQLGIFQFDEKKDIETVVTEIGKDTAKNLVNVSPAGKIIVAVGEKIANRVAPDGYNWNREPWTDPMLDFVVNARDGIAAIADSTFDVTRLDNFVEDITPEDIKFNEELAEEIAGDFMEAIEFTLDMGTTLLKTPVKAPLQEFVKPVFRDSQIKIIREVGFSDVDDPQEFSQRVFDLYERRSELRQKSKTERLSDQEQRDLKWLDKFATKSNSAADSARDAETESMRHILFGQMETLLDLTESVISDI